MPDGGIYKGEDRAKLINESTLSIGGKALLLGILTDGGAAQFGSFDNPNMGVDYEFVYKKLLNHQVVDGSLQELSSAINEDTTDRGIQIDAVLAPETSAPLFAGVLSSLLKGKPPCIPVQKNGSKGISPVSDAVDSYSGGEGKVDVMSIPVEVLEILQRKKGGNEINVVLCDDILDTGAMTIAMALLVQIAREKGFNINLMSIVSPLEKIYTHVRETIEATVGNVPVYSSIKVSDMGIYKGIEPWMKVEGITQAFACGIRDFRVKNNK